MNLEFCSEKTRNEINELLDCPTIRNAAKDMIRAGLERDCVDAAFDAKLAARALSAVMNDILGG